MRTLTFTRRLIFSMAALTLPTLVALPALGEFGPFGRARADDSAPATTPGGDQRVDRGPVILELFTSQGCSSCPPADRLLSRLASDEDLRSRVVPLAFHVDYWNYIGWQDPFSSSRWSERQEGYARALPGGRLYTPQLVVGGREICVGSRDDCVAEAIGEAFARPAEARVELEIESLNDGLAELRASYRLGETDGTSLPELVTVLFENGLETKVSRGENRGAKLQNDFVVRRLRQMPILLSDTSRLGNASFAFRLEKGWRTDRLGVAAFLQDPETLAIHGAAVAYLEASE